MRRTAILVACLGLAGSGTAAAQTLEDMQTCRAIADAARRLACYDAIQLVQSARPKYAVTDLSDLQSYALSYRGQLVEVSGWIEPGDDFYVLGVDAADPNAIPVNFDAIGRRDLQAFKSACGDGCEATVQGRVSPVNFTTGIVADTVVAH